MHTLFHQQGPGSVSVVDLLHALHLKLQDTVLGIHALDHSNDHGLVNDEVQEVGLRAKAYGGGCMRSAGILYLGHNTSALADTDKLAFPQALQEHHIAVEWPAIACGKLMRYQVF